MAFLKEDGWPLNGYSAVTPGEAAGMILFPDYMVNRKQILTFVA